MQTNHDLESIFFQAMELVDPARRGEFLDKACAGDEGVRNRISALLVANQRAAEFMAEPAGILEFPDPSDLPIGEQAGDVVGRYKLLQQIGVGGMGIVFMAEQQEPVRRKVALKIVKPGLDTKEVIARFESERQALAMLSHANIARVLDAGASQQGRPYFVMELVRGVSITEYCNDARLSTRERLKLFVPICHAIQHAHQKGIIHRDIKPRNVMITLMDGKPVPKVIDFGIAKAIDHRLTEKTLFTRYGEFIGTPAYMSPEQAALSGIDVDTRSDVYSLGALLYELLAGVPPFDSDQLKTLGHEEMRRFIRDVTPAQPSVAIGTAGADRATTVAQARSTTPRELRSLVHGELDWIVMRSLEKDRNRRYDTAIALADDIQRYLQNDPVIARPATATYRLSKFLAKHRLAVGSATAVALILLIATCVSGWLAANAMRSSALAADETASLRQVVDFINDGLFAQADPFQEANRNVKLRTVLDRAAQRLDSRAIERPSVEAALRTTIGETYRGLGEYAHAVAHLKRAYQLNLDRHGAADPKSIEAANRLGAAMAARADYDGAAALMEKTLETAQRQLAPHDPLLLNAMTLSADCQAAKGEFQKAETLLRAVLDRRQRKWGDDHPDTYHAMANLASVLQNQGRLGDALALLSAAQEGMLETEVWHPATLKMTTNLAGLHLARNESDLAAEIYEQAVPKATRLLGPKHVQTLAAKHGLALIRFSQNRTVEADTLLEEVLTGLAEQLGKDHPRTWAAMHNMARLRQAQGRYQEAEELLRAELEIRQVVNGPDHASHLTTVTSLAFLHLDQAQFEKAIPLYQSAAGIAARHDDDPNFIICLTMLALCRHKIGDDAQARSDLVRAQSACATALPDHWLQFVVESLLGEVSFALGHRVDAEDALLRGYEGLKRHESDLPPRWKPLGLRAATRRLAEFYEAAEEVELQSRAKAYRDELAVILNSGSFPKGHRGNTRDGISN